MSAVSSMNAFLFAADVNTASKALGVFPSCQVSPFGPFMCFEFNIAYDTAVECQFKTKQQKKAKKQICGMRGNTGSSVPVFVFLSFRFHA